MSLEIAPDLVGTDAMLVRMNGLVKRGGMWQYRREVPPRLRSIIEQREVERSLGTDVVLHPVDTPR